MSFAAGRIDVENFGERAVAENHAFLRINHGDAFHHASQNGARTVALTAQQANFAIEAGSGLIQRIAEIGEFVLRPVEIQRTEIAFGDATGEIPQPADTRGKRTGEENRERDADDEKNRSDTE